MTLRIGCYICHCGINIAHKVRVADVAEFARHIPGVSVARDYKFMCSDPGQEMIETDIRDFHLNRVVVASCSPRLHEKTFQAACRRAGLNPYLFQMASVREQVSWVTRDEDEATFKAKVLVAGAINRVRLHQGLERREVGVHPDVMVVGGGIAGMQAALDIGQGGHKVYLVEKNTTVGGHMLQFDKTFPTLDCAACIGTPKMVEVAQNPNVELLSYTSVEEVSGYIGNYTVKVRRRARFVQEGVCTGCGACAEACPVLLPSEWDQGLGRRKAIFRAFPQAVPITFCIDKTDRAPCVKGCPAGANVQGYVQLIRDGKFQAALELIMQKIPLPGVLGRVCPHPCEAQCRRREIDQPVAIRDLKRFAADQVDWKCLPVPDIQDKPQKAAIIGSGPAGLTVAYDLRRLGYQVTVFEALEKPGGMLRVGIPDYRLPPDILDREINYIERLGVKIRTRMRFGSGITLSSLQKDGFDVVYFGIGAHAPMKLDIPGEEATARTGDAVEFLRRVNLGRRTCPGRDVVVIGGGNVALDAARTALRLGAQNVSIVYRRSAREMPAYADEIKGAVEEGICFVYLTTPVRMLIRDNAVIGLECIRNELGPPDAGGRRRPVPIQGSEFVIDCDCVLPAIGQRMDTGCITSEDGLALTRRGFIQTDPLTFQTSLAHVFAGGDAVSGPATVVEAVAAGHRAAAAMARFLEGREVHEALHADPEPEETPNWRPIDPDCPIQDRQEMRQVDAALRTRGFTEEFSGLDEDQARLEAGRCLNCGLCCECMQCVQACEAGAIDHRMTDREQEIQVGSIILATGYDVMDPTPLRQFGYGRYPNVYTSLEFERLSNATGPTAGKILIRDRDGEFSLTPKSVAILHCIGSRDVNYHEYCSRVCCMYALKYAHLIKEKVGHDTRVSNFYIDMRCFGKGYEEFFRRCQEEGTQFIRGKAAQITDQAQSLEEKGRLVVIAEDTLLGRVLRVPVDMVILCVAMEARPDASEVSRIFGVNVGPDGFFLESHPKLGPLETATDGIFLAGACQGPKDIPDTVAQASGAAAKALSLASAGKVQIPSAISWIDPDICAGCRICIGLCAYSAIEFDERRQVSVVNEAACKGCGSCSGFCPSGAAGVRHFRKKQVFAELDGILAASQGA